MDTVIQELLIRAAQAAHIELDLSGPCKDGFRARHWGQWTECWAPHRDDGDSRRLEVALAMHVAVRPLGQQLLGFHADTTRGSRVSILHQGDPLYGTRMAVLCAAAGMSGLFQSVPEALEAAYVLFCR